MALETSSVALPREVVTTVIDKVKGTSTIAALSPAEPYRFDDKTYLVFNASAEADVVAEGGVKGSADPDIAPVVATRSKVVTTTRVSSELQWADEDDQLEIISHIVEDQAAAMGRALDYIVYHAVSPRTGEALEGYTALAATANQVTASGDYVADMDALADDIIDYDITGIAMSRTLANELRKVRNDDGVRLYPDIPLNLQVGTFDGIPAATSSTVNGVRAATETGVLGIMGDYNLIKWGMVRDVTAEVIPYGDPDNTGVDLKAYNQVAYRTEAVFGFAVLDPAGFVVLRSA